MKSTPAWNKVHFAGSSGSDYQLWCAQFFFYWPDTKAKYLALGWPLWPAALYIGTHNHSAATLRSLQWRLKLVCTVSSFSIWLVSLARSYRRCCCLPPFAIHILSRLDMRIHHVAPKIYHTYSKIRVNRDWVIRFLGFFWWFLRSGARFT